jgi:LacI family transcriptional regulator
MDIGLISALRHAGVAVPGDVAVAGFDDIPISRYMTPPLSTVHVSISDLGARAMDRLVRAVEEGSRHARTREIVPTTLVLRGSCGCEAPEGGAAG